LSPIAFPSAGASSPSITAGSRFGGRRISVTGCDLSGDADIHGDALAPVAVALEDAVGRFEQNLLVGCFAGALVVQELDLALEGSGLRGIAQDLKLWIYNTVVIFVWCELFERRLGVRVATATMR
jgi:hypothetical protein